MAIQFNRRLIDKGTYEAACVFDVNGNGIPDIVCGAFWYEGPDFLKKHKICDIMPEGEYYDDFSDFGMDVNGNGLTDIITGGWWGEALRWRENPGNDGEWITHDIDRCGSIETIRFMDIDGCGIPEVFPNTPGRPQCFYKLITDKNGKGTGRFDKFVISEGPSGHGMGFADINGNGKTDIVLSGGWLEQPESLFDGPWIFHDEFDLGSASVPILGYDITGNGLTDLIVGNAHGYGLWWMEQSVQNGLRSWTRHLIDDSAAQYHDLKLADIDNDGDIDILSASAYDGTIAWYEHSPILGVNTSNQLDFSLYPNPTSGKLTINSNQKINNIEVYSQLGQLILSVPKKNEIDISYLNSGIYFIKITDEKENSTVKKVIKK